jgi:DNA-binding IclR family transcriptional regulator
MGSASSETVTHRALSILDAFSVDRPALSLLDISRRAGLPKSTAHRLIAELVAWGALERGEVDNLYRIGLKVWEIGSLAPRGRGLAEIALPFLEDVYQSTRQTVMLGVLDGTETVYIERRSGPKAVPTEIRPGRRLPVHATGVGLALLAYAPFEKRQQVLAAPLARFTDLTVTDPDRLRKILADIRRVGYAVSDRQVESQGVSIAAPVHGKNGVVLAALSVVVRPGTDPRNYAPVVLMAARGLSRALETAQ